MRLDPGQNVRFPLPPKRHGWVQITDGSITLNAAGMRQGDGAAISDEASLNINPMEPAQLLIFDLP